MAEATVGSLRYTFEADTSALKTSLQDVQSRLNQMSSSAGDMGRRASAAAHEVGSSFKSMADKVADAAYNLGPWTGQHVEIARASIVGLQGAFGSIALAAGAAAAAAAAAMAAIGMAAVHMGEAAEKAKSQFDLTGAGMARLSAVAMKSGTDLTSLATALKTVSDNAKQGDDGLVDAADAIGVSVSKLKSSDLPGLLRTLQQAYSQTADSANKYAAFQKILGDEFEKLYPVMQRGVGFMDGLYAAADRSGAAISGTLQTALSGTINLTHQAGSAWTELKMSIEGAVMALYEKFKPAIDGAIVGFTGLIQNIASAVQYFAQASRESTAVSLALDAISTAGKALVTVLAAITAAFQGLVVVAVGAMEQVQNAINGVIGTAKELWKALTFQGGSPLETLKGAGQKMAADAEGTAKRVAKIYDDLSKTVKATWGDGGKPIAGVSGGGAGALRNVRALSGGGGNDGGGGAEVDQIKQYVESLKEAQRLAQAELDSWGKSNVERAKALELVKAENVAQRAGKTLTDEEKKAITETAGATQSLKDKLDDLKKKQQELNQAARQWADTFASAFDELIVRGKKLKEVLADLLRSLASMSLKGLLTGSGGGGGILGSLFSGIFSGFKGFFAEGGNIPPGGWGIAGEKGPELITGPANVTPMHKIGSGGANVTVHNYAAGVQVEPQVTRDGVKLMIRSAISQYDEELIPNIQSKQSRSW